MESKPNRLNQPSATSGWLQRLRWYFRNNRFQQEMRRRRMRRFLDTIRPPQGARIIDLGGTEELWRLIDHDFSVTLVNITEQRRLSHDSRYTYVTADACNLSDLYQDREFDVAYSNSVLEHVGDDNHQQQFSREIQRLGKAYWVQVPHPSFPIEAHTGVPFFWQLPNAMRRFLMRRWRKRLPAWTRMVDETRPVPYQRMKALFPEAEVDIERFMLIPKSIFVYRRQRD